MKMSLFMALILGAISPAMATIDIIKGSTCFNGCKKDIVQLVAQGETFSFEVVGQFVDGSTGVEISGSGVSVSYGTRKSGNNSSIIVKLAVGDNAAEGVRTVKLHYAIEMNGPDTFTIKVVRKGTINQIQYKQQVPIVAISTNHLRAAAPAVQQFQQSTQPATATQPAPQFRTELVPPTNIPPNEKVVLVITGTKLDKNIRLGPSQIFRNVRFLPGATASKCEIELEYTGSLNTPVPLAIYASLLADTDILGGNLSHMFLYTGGLNNKIQFAQAQTSSSGANTSPLPVIQPHITTQSSSPPAVVDVMPRAAMVNIFRRISPNPSPAFTEVGIPYFQLNSFMTNPPPEMNCSGMTGRQSKVVVVPDLIWGVSSPGSAGVNTLFLSQLSAGGSVLSTENVTGMLPGQTIDFRFHRQNSRIQISTFVEHPGCFVSPSLVFFEDPRFTVVVDTNNALNEAAADKVNNRKDF
jgi:hypothetical protein